MLHIVTPRRRKRHGRGVSSLPEAHSGNEKTVSRTSGGVEVMPTVQTCPKCLTRWHVGPNYPEPCPKCENKRLQGILDCVRVVDRIHAEEEYEKQQAAQAAKEK